VLSDDLPISDKLCQRFVLFIYNCFFCSSSLVNFVSRYGIIFSHYMSNLGGNFYFRLSGFKFNKQSSFMGVLIFIILFTSNVLV